MKYQHLRHHIWYKNLLQNPLLYFQFLQLYPGLLQQLGKELKILKEIIDAPPTDGLWDDGRTDEGQLGLSYKELEEAMNNEGSKNRDKYLKIRKANLHKMEPIPVCKIPN